MIVVEISDRQDHHAALGDRIQNRSGRIQQRAPDHILRDRNPVAVRDPSLGGGEHLAERLQAFQVTEEGVEHPFRDSVVTNLVKLVDILPKLNVTAIRSSRGWPHRCGLRCWSIPRN